MGGDGSDSDLRPRPMQAATLMVKLRRDCGDGVKMEGQKKNRKNEKSANRAPSKRDFGHHSLDDHTL